MICNDPLLRNSPILHCIWNLYFPSNRYNPQPAPRLTWVISLQQVPAVESSAFGVAHLQALLQQPLGDVALADACVPEASHVIMLTH